MPSGANVPPLLPSEIQALTSELSPVALGLANRAAGTQELTAELLVRARSAAARLVSGPEATDAQLMGVIVPLLAGITAGRKYDELLQSGSTGAIGVPKVSGGDGRYIVTVVIATADRTGTAIGRHIAQLVFDTVPDSAELESAAQLAVNQGKISSPGKLSEEAKITSFRVLSIVQA